MLHHFFFVNLCILVYTNYAAAANIEYSCLNSTLSSISCQDSHISCDANRDCFVSCTSRQKCSNAMIDCPLTGDCIIECRGSRTCENLIVNATHSRSGSLNVICEDGKYDQCTGIKIYGSQSEQNTNDVNLLCNGQGHSCVSSQVQCPRNGDCFVSCNSDSSCENSTISGPDNGGLIVSCNGPLSCSDAVIDAAHADELDVTGCTQTDACLDVSIACPPYTNYSAPNCFIEGNDNLVISKLYAIHGWQDVEFAYSGGFNYKSTYRGGVLYCGYGYTHHCSLSLEKWKCADADDYCNVIQIDHDTDSHQDSNHTNSHHDTDHDTDSHHDSNHDSDHDTDHHDTDHDTDHHYDDHGHHDYNVSYLAPPKDMKYEHGAMGMVLIGAGLIALALGCVVCGSIRKAYDQATRKLSDMGFKSPFKSPYKERNLHEKYRKAYSSEQIGNWMDGIEHSVDESRVSMSRSGYAPQPGNAANNNNNNKTATLTRPESHTAHIHRPNSHSGTYTATIHRQNSQSNTHTNRDIPMYAARQQSHPARNTHASYHHSGSSLHQQASGYYAGVHGHEGHHNVAAARSKHGYHGSKSTGHLHGKRNSHHNAEMVQFR